MRFHIKGLILNLILVMVVWGSGLTQASAVILELKSMRDVGPLVDPQTLVVFDIDNTLIEQAQTLGSDQWFRFVLKNYIDHGMKADAALAKSMAFWKEINEVSRVNPVERGTPFLIRKMQDAGIKVMVLTARGTDAVGLTERHLREGNMDFSRSTISKDSDVLIDQGLRYRRGVLFSSGQDKGLSLLRFLKYFHISPPKVVFIDDLSKNVMAMEAALTLVHINVVNVRYGALDAKVRAFNSKIPLVEWGVFSKYHRLISDAQAWQILSANGGGVSPVD